MSSPSIAPDRRWRPGASPAASFASSLALLLALPLAVRANLVVNGDFEEPWVTETVGWRNFAAGQSFPGWTVGSGSVDVVRIVIPDQGDAWTAASGQQSVDLNGFGPGSIYQDVPTVPGMTYYLSFALAGNVVGGPLVVSMDFLWNDSVVDTLTFDVGPHDGYNMGWAFYQYAITAPADATQARLVFESLSNTGARGPAIDDVVLGETPRDPVPVFVPPVRDVATLPDPGSPAVLLGLGWAAVGAARVRVHRSRET